ncbi:hypothetical protein CC80DRAFT_490012 [Byssothecium circinans]|uniref:CDR ABC transporter domain-containing protein n=1 Tax=Byssothecium circinans TaxID=147558 RepID=A0A6A5U4B5_9PLEO|nr:hypothetical protein CC80DRAFT_490012 [Byssothecium circinans]
MESCEVYLQEYVSEFGGVLVPSSSDGTCSLCPLTSTKAVLEALEIHGDWWWRLGVTFGFVLFNIVGTFVIYWVTSVRVTSKRK